MTPAERQTSPGGRALGRWRAHLPYAAIGLLALVVRLLYLLEIAGSDAMRVYLGDARAYELWAREILAGDWIGHGVFYQAPLYPYFLAVVHGLLGSGPLAIRIVQMLLGSGACVLLALAGRDLFSRRVGVIAGAIWALYPPAFFFDGIVQKASLTGLLFAVLLFLLGRYFQSSDPGAAPEGRPPRLLGLAAGAALGAMALNRENALILAPVVLGWLLLRLRARSRRLRATAAAAVLAGMLLVLLPVALRNLAVGGEFQLTTAQFGPNLYLGNNPHTDGTYQPLRSGRGDPRAERADATWLAEQALGRTLSPAEVSRYWTGQVWEYVRAQPFDWLVLQGRKLLLVFNAIEIGDTEDIYTYAESSRLLRWLLRVFHMGVLLPLAVMGAALWWRRRGAGLILALAAAYALGALASVIYARYRYPLVPLLALFAAGGLAEIPTYLREPSGLFAPGRRMRAAGILALGALAAVVANRSFYDPDSYRVSTHANIANELITAKEYDRALAHLRAALALAPEYPNAHHLLGVALSDLGRAQEAEAHYRAAIAGEPDTAMPYYCLGTLLASQQRWDEAIEQYRLALARDPTHANSYGNLAIALSQQGQAAEAIALFERGLQLEPNSPEMLFDYGLALRRAGRTDEARQAFERLLARWPEHLPALHNLVSLDLAAGAPERARARLEDAARTHPDDAGTRLRLAWLLVSHPDARVRDGRRGLTLARELSQDGRSQDARFLDLLAAALAETGAWDRAAQVARRAARAASAAGVPELASEITARAALYERGQSYRAASW